MPRLVWDETEERNGKITLRREDKPKQPHPYRLLIENEAHYLKVLMDMVFGRGNFISEIIGQKHTSRENRAATGIR